MERSMQRFYPKQLSMVKFTSEQKLKGKTTPIKLINKISRAKKQSCCA
jgi:hypothetical protein